MPICWKKVVVFLLQKNTWCPGANWDKQTDIFFFCHQSDKTRGNQLLSKIIKMRFRRKCNRRKWKVIKLVIFRRKIKKIASQDDLNVLGNIQENMFLMKHQFKLYQNVYELINFEFNSFNFNWIGFPWLSFMIKNLFYIKYIFLFSPKLNLDYTNSELFLGWN